MKTNIILKALDGNITRTIDLPNVCPHCGEKINPYIHGHAYTDNKLSDAVMDFGFLVSCPAENCKAYFALQYSKKLTQNTSQLITYKYRPPIESDLPENIEKISSSFVEIFNQATMAESEKLNQIAGVGYRKALEFLLKDYAISKNPSKEDSIKKLFLGKVIEKYLSDFPKLQSLAQAATWIGNDETHYVRRHDDKDLRDMKQFIRSATHFIVADYDADIANKFIAEND
jgi:hypothetical protein